MSSRTVFTLLLAGSAGVLGFALGRDLGSVLILLSAALVVFSCVKLIGHGSGPV